MTPEAQPESGPGRRAEASASGTGSSGSRTGASLSGAGAPTPRTEAKGESRTEDEPVPRTGEEGTASQAANVEVLVVGAGPAGLTLGGDLARRGVAALVVEASAGLFPGSRGKGIQPRSQEVFDDLGVLGAMRAEGSSYPEMAIWENGERTGTWDMVERTPPTPAEPYVEPLMLPQWRTQEILAARLAELGGKVEFNARITGVAQDADGVTAEITGPDGSCRSVRARYLVGADGGRSTVRRSIGVSMTGEQLGSGAALVADVRLEGLDRDHWHVWPKAEGGALAVCPLSGTDVYQVVAQFAPADGEDELVAPEATAEAVRATLVARSHLTAEQIKDVRWVSLYRPRVALAERFRVGRVFLVGDAAHVHPPTGGQGLNTSVQDAYNLGWKLGQVLRHGAPGTLLDSYEEERLPVAADVLGISTRLHRASEAKGLHSSVRRGRETQQLGITYREGTLAAEHRAAVADGLPQAGDRAPQASATTGAGADVTLFDAFRGPHFTLLAIGDAEPPAQVPDWVRVQRLDGQEIRQTYGQGLFLIRPDGHVGTATTTAQDVTAYLERVSG